MKTFLFFIFFVWSFVNGQEGIANLDFASIVGGPLIAAINAQAQSAATTLNFIQDAAFIPSTQPNQTSEVAYVNFAYDSVFEGQLRKFTMSLPLLTLLPIPYLEIQEMEVDFNVKITSQESFSSYNSRLNSEVTNQFSSSGDSTFSFNGNFFTSKYSGSSLNFRGEVRNQEVSSSFGTEKKEYNVHVRVKAGQSATPPGVQKIFDLLDRITREDVPFNETATP